jgi:mRNA interferase RelE/StbE
MYQLKLSSRSQRELEKLSARDLERIAEALRKLEDNPRPAGTRKLRGQIYRIRVGDWRIIYAILDREKIVLIGKIARRSKDTYNGVDDLF